MDYRLRGNVLPVPVVPGMIMNSLSEWEPNRSSINLPEHRMGGARTVSGGNTMAKDPVCGMQVEENKAAATSVYRGATYYFCAPGCKATFDKNPEKFVGQSETHTNS